MKGWLLDTNILSELRRLRPEPRVVAFVSEQPLDTLFISVVTLAEIRFGIEKLDDGARRQQILSWLDHEVRPLFDGRVLPLSEDVMLRWRLILEDGRRRGHTFSHPDVLIAATAAHFGLTVASRDTSDFVAAGVPCTNPWRAE